MTADDRVTRTFATAPASLVTSDDTLGTITRLLIDAVDVLQADGAGLVLGRDQDDLELFSSTSHRAEDSNCSNCNPTLGRAWMLRVAVFSRPRGTSRKSRRRAASGRGVSVGGLCLAACLTHGLAPHCARRRQLLLEHTA